MNRKEIEAQDQQVMAKVRTILQLKQRRQRRIPWRILLLTVVVFGIGGGLLWREPAMEKPAILAADTQEAEAPANARADRPPAPLPQVVNDQSSASIELDAPVEPEAHSAPKEDRSTTAEIAGLTTCRSIKVRQPLFPAQLFSLRKKQTPHLWMEVHATALPFTLRHVYFHEAQKYCEVPLQISYPRMRTWSNISLARPDMTGSWRVDVVDDAGRILAQAQFTVVP